MSRFSASDGPDTSGSTNPAPAIDSRTRMVALDRLTRRDAARDFRGEANVPAYAITMGVGTILQAKELALLAWGESKAAILREAIEGPQIDTVPASFLQRHPNCRCYIDEAAARELTRFRVSLESRSRRLEPSAHPQSGRFFGQRFEKTGLTAAGRRLR